MDNLRYDCDKYGRDMSLRKKFSREKTFHRDAICRSEDVFLWKNGDLYGEHDKKESFHFGFEVDFKIDGGNACYPG